MTRQGTTVFDDQRIPKTLIDGPQGAPGVDGVQGPQGNRGDGSGPQGEQGDQGFQGYQGNQGPQGITVLLFPNEDAADAASKLPENENILCIYAKEMPSAPAI